MKKQLSKAGKLVVVAATSICLLSACATIDPKTGERKDPLEKFNRAMWNINYNYLDPYILKPAAEGWKNYVPMPLRVGLVNIANNLDEPASFVNYLLEGKPKIAMLHFTRFWFNTIFGLGGLIDWADKIPSLTVSHDSDRRFGDTLGVYGVKTGPYVMLPAYGPATPREDLGNLADYTYPVFSLLEWPVGLAKYVVQGLDKRAALLGKGKLLKDSQDPYIMFREAYFQNLNYRIHGDKAVVKPEPQLSQADLDEIDG